MARVGTTSRTQTKTAKNKEERNGTETSNEKNLSIYLESYGAKYGHTRKASKHLGG